MMRNISKSTYLGNGHALSSKLASEPCKYVFFLKKNLDLKHDQDLTEHNFKHWKLYIWFNALIA